MRALLLAAGLGTRLRPLTLKTPKCLMPIKGKPLLEIWLERLIEVQISPILVNTHYLADQVTNFISQMKYSKEVIVVNEEKLLGTAGTIIKNAAFFDGQDGMVIHGDNYSMIDLQALQQAHFNRPKECLMTMVVFETLEPHLCGIVELDNKGIVINFYEKIMNPPGNLANGAIYILSAELIDVIKRGDFGRFDISIEIIPKLLGKIFSFKTYDVLIDIGSRESYLRANK